MELKAPVPERGLDVTTRIEEGANGRNRSFGDLVFGQFDPLAGGWNEAILSGLTTVVYVTAPPVPGCKVIGTCSSDKEVRVE